MSVTPKYTAAFPLFEDPPHIELLQWLARGSLKQNLLRAVRLWVWLHSLYGTHQCLLPAPFTYAQWRDAFFSDSHPKGEVAPPDHDPCCACAKTTADWLFTPQTSLVKTEWRSLLQHHTSIPHEVIQDWLSKRLFAVTRRSLFADLQILTELGWLTCDGSSYHRVQQFPIRPIVEPTVSDRLGLYDLGFLNPNLEAIAEELSQPIAEVQRFYLEVDYIIAQTQRQVEKWLEMLKKLWETAVVPPVQLVYQSAKSGRVTCCVYPVCVYYVQRAIYLCAFGQNPSGKGEWYNYRLDKIQQMLPLQWGDLALPKILRQRQTTLPLPSYISTQMRQAWGFDFYLPAKLMLLRFDCTFHDRYIRNTFRHHTFRLLTLAEAKQLVQDYATPSHQKTLLKLIQSRPPEDAYYSVMHRAGDTNVGLRLRAWRPNVEILLPWELRQEVTKEVNREWKIYWESENERKEREK